MSSTLDAIFKPKTIAVIGASTKPGSIGNVIVRNLRRFQYRGRLYPVNPRAEKIEELDCYPSVMDIPDNIDLAIIVVPRDLVKPALEQCGEKGVKGVITITSGFKEIGGEGIAKENELVEIIKKYGIRMVGPNCYGVLNTDPEVSLNSTFSKLNPLKGKVGFMSQSGALGEVVIDYTNSLNLGFSMFASVGNKADVSDIDILQYWKDDPHTEMILLYLENIEQPQKFTHLAREITRHKPIFAVKAGRTMAGAKAISSHTGVLAGGDAATDAVFKQCGIIRSDTIDELFDAAQAFAAQPLLKGDRIAVITNAGGPGHESYGRLP
jgi:acyl-CoA synthetase (NDP forming)